MKRISFSLLILMLLSLYSQNVSSQSMTVPEMLEYRSLGPYRVGSWLSAIAVPNTDDPAYKYTYYIAARHGGVWKTENNGTSFFPVFDSAGIPSIGAVAVSNSNPEVVWIGTGEAYSARSSHAGKGVFRSTNGGKSWELKGLEDSQHISTVIIHPEDPDIVWIASMGHLFSPNAMRGVFKTIDGGETWEKVLYIDENTGIIDLIIDPFNPDVLFAAAYEKYRLPWHFEAGGINSGIYKTSDGGSNWSQLTAGLPSGKLGKIGLALCYQQPNIIYAVIENLNPKPGVVVDETIEMNYMRDPYFDQLVGGEVYRSDNSGADWTKMNEDSCNVSSKAAYSFNKILVSPENPDEIYVISDLMPFSNDGGRTWNDCFWPPREKFTNMFGDHRCFWVNPHDGRHMMIGSDGGLHVTYDAGKTINHIAQIPLGEIYIVETDNAYPYNIYLGLQDHDGWKGPSNSWSGNIGMEDWDLVGMWDGMYTRVDPQDNRWVYITTQFGAHHRVDQKTGERVRIEPTPSEGDPPYRFCWTTPFELSPHNPKIVYTGGQMLLRSFDQGDNWEEISPDLTTNDTVKIHGRGHMMYCTITSISESPVKAGVIWVGTDDGRVHVTLDHGKNWTEMTTKIDDIGGDKDYWVSRVLSSRYIEGQAFVCKSGFRNDDFEPLVFKTSDFGKTWQKITEGLPDAPVNVVIEDPRNDELLYAGTDAGVYVSFNGGLNWTPFINNMPVSIVKDIKIQEEENDLVVGTYGRGAYIADVSLLQGMHDSIFDLDQYLFDIESKPQRNMSQRAWWGNYEMLGDNYLLMPNEPNALLIYYYFKSDPGTDVSMEIVNLEGKVIGTPVIIAEAGLHRTAYSTWYLTPGTYKIRLITPAGIIEKMAVIKKPPVWPVGHGLK